MAIPSTAKEGATECGGKHGAQLKVYKGRRIPRPVHGKPTFFDPALGHPEKARRSGCSRAPCRSDG